MSKFTNKSFIFGFMMTEYLLLAFATACFFASIIQPQFWFFLIFVETLNEHVYQKVFGILSMNLVLILECDEPLPL